MKTQLRNIAVFSLASGILLALAGAEETDKPTSVRTQYHDVLVQIAEVELQIANEANRKTPGVYVAQTMARLKTNVDVAQKLRERAAMDYGDMPEAHVLYAEARAQLAEKDYLTAVEVSKRNPNSIPELRLEKIRLNAELAKLRVEMWKHPGNVSSLVDHMQWEIDQLSQEILQLHKRLERLELK